LIIGPTGNDKKSGWQAIAPRPVVTYIKDEV
jgi:hypothetical protein